MTTATIPRAVGDCGPIREAVRLRECAQFLPIAALQEAA